MFARLALFLSVFCFLTFNIFLFAIHAQNFDFISIKNGYTHGEQSNVNTVKDEHIIIPDKDGIISAFPVNLKSGTTIYLGKKIEEKPEDNLGCPDHTEHLMTT